MIPQEVVEIEYEIYAGWSEACYETRDYAGAKEKLKHAKSKLRPILEMEPKNQNLSYKLFRNRIKINELDEILGASSEDRLANCVEIAEMFEKGKETVLLRRNRHGDRDLKNLTGALHKGVQIAIDTEETGKAEMLTEVIYNIETQYGKPSSEIVLPSSEGVVGRRNASCCTAS